MTPPDFSVLLLAWDEADPAVAILGGAALPPTLPLVYRLAARQPVLAVYPHLPGPPAGEATGTADSGPPAANPAALGGLPASAEENSVAKPEEAATPPVTALGPTSPTPGVRWLPGPAPAVGAPAGPAAAPVSRLVGLAELRPTASGPLAAPAAAPAVSRGPLLLAAGRGQWPTGPTAPAGAGLRAPAAPYVGSGAESPLFLPSPPAPPRPAPGATPASALAALRPATTAQAGDLRFDPDPLLPRMPLAAAFDEATPEIGPAEAADLFSAQDDLTPETADAPAQTAAPAGPFVTPLTAVAAPESPAAGAPETSGLNYQTLNLDGLNFRMIAYARHAVQLVDGRADYTVIYAPDWPAWLAALEIRNRTGRPLVLYVAALAADFLAPAERGWLLEIERMALRRAHTLLVPTAALAARLRAQYGSGLGRVQVAAADDEAAVRQALAAAAGNLLADV